MTVRAFLQPTITDYASATRHSVWFFCDTTAELPSASVLNGDIAYCKDTNTDYLRTGDAWVAQVGTATVSASYRNLFEREGSHTAAKAAGTYALAPVAAVSGTGTLAPQGVFYYDPADHPNINGLSAKLRIRAQVFCNDVAPTGTYIVGLYPVTRPATSGAAGLCTFTLGTVVAGSQTATVNAPAADSSTSVAGSDFTAPAAGFYCLGFVQTGTVATSAHLHIAAQLQMRNN